jgi:UMF1 family MFS transporter
MRRLNREIWGWALYDWANSAFAVSILAVLLPMYFTGWLATSGLDASGEYIKEVTIFGVTVLSSSLWSWTVSLSMVFVVILSPIVGAMADYGGKKKAFLALFCVLGASATGLMVLLQVGMWKLGVLLFILANICFVGGNVVYNGLLVEVAPTEEEVAFVSGFGWGLGYMASFLMLLLNLLMIWFDFPTEALAMRVALMSVGIWWALFAIPTFLWVQERAKPKPLPEGENLLTAGFAQLRETARHLHLYPQLLLFVAAFFLYNDGIQTIISQASNFAQVVWNRDVEDLIGVFLMIQIVAFFGSFLFIRVEEKAGTKRTLLASLVVWLALIGWGMVMQNWIELWIMAFFGGLVLGVSQSASRTIYAWMIPKAKSAEFFSLYAIVGKIASILGPFLFGIGAAFAPRLMDVPILNPMALAVLPLFLMVLAGTILLKRVDVDAGRESVRQAQESA